MRADQASVALVDAIGAPLPVASPTPPAPVDQAARPRSPFIPELESLRGLAAFSVVVEHAFLYGDRPVTGWFAQHNDNFAIWHWLIHVLFNGRASVVLFFVLSGYVLARQLQDQPIGSLRGAAAYAIRRAFRILPAMWLAVALAFAVAWFNRPGPHLNADLIVRTLLLQDISLNTPFWTLFVEIGCSVLFPLLYLMNARSHRLVGLALLAPLALGLLLIPPFQRFDFLRYVLFFQVGILAGVWGPAVIAAIAPRWRAAGFAAAFLLYGLAPQLWPFNERWFGFYEDRYYLLLEAPACFYMLAYIVTQPDNALRALLRWGPVRYLGKISFSLYLLHFIVSDHLWPHYGSASAFSFLWPYQLLFQFTFFLIVAGIAIPFAMLSYHAVEMPFHRLGRRLAARIGA